MKTHVDHDDHDIDDLKSMLQKMPHKEFEHLAASLISKLLNIPIAVAKSGFQFGGDAGPSGRKGRRFRIEAKRYADNTALSSRELLGEIDHAIARDPALEAWFLVATKNVPEQLEQDLQHKSEAVGVPVVIVDWKENPFPSLAALCCIAPELLEKHLNKAASQIANRLKSKAENSLDQLTVEMQSWALGFLSLRDKSHENLKSLWTNRAKSVAQFGQDVAGGSRTSTIRRQDSFDALSRWWSKSPDNLAPAVLCGIEGYGKTWAAVDWLNERRDELPIILALPSSKFLAIHHITQTTVLETISEALAELTKVRDTEHWKLRLSFLLQKPSKEGPVICLFIDGLNQEPSVPWQRFLQIVQDEPFAGKIRVIATTRNHHLEERLRHLSGLITPPARIDM